MKVSLYFSFFLSLGFLSCKTESVNTPSRPDPHSFSLPQIARAVHLDLELDINFDNRLLSGVARWTIDHAGASEIIFDIDGLDIQKITLGPDETETTFELGERDSNLGQALRVNIQPETRQVNIYYQTSPDAAALGWLEPAQTAGKTSPFLFTQGQSILTRTWIPCQDSPGNRITYRVTVQAPPGMLVVMSAVNPQSKSDNGRYTFDMPQPIPPYLIALAAGDIAFLPIGPRTGVYAEPSLVEKASWEFAELEKMLEVTESLYGPYAWERYDLIVLPPSFPFGGMENPRLTFATPTIIAGDRSLTSLVAHELAHSWSGNLVTNATWNDFWLNEGVTTYLERRIMEAIYGKPFSDMLAIIAYYDMEADIEAMGGPQAADSRLRLDLAGRHPDDGTSNVAYEKGALFFTWLEQAAGREKFDAFLKKYFDTYRFQTITTDQFMDFLEKNLLQPNNLSLDYRAWIDGPGIPASAPKLKSTLLEQTKAEAARFLNGVNPNEIQIKGWSTNEWVYFIRELPDSLAIDRMAALDEAFNLSYSGNAEIRAAWLDRAIFTGYSRTIESTSLAPFLLEVGRKRFVKPLFTALVKTGQADLAKQIFEKASPGYHAVTRRSVEELLR